MTEPDIESGNTESSRLGMEFHGSGEEYFRIWIVNMLLTLVTLGIYSAWAKVRRLQYFYGNLSLDNHRFAYLADPLQILKGRLIAVALLAVFSVGWNFFPSTAMALLAIGTLLIPAILVASWRFKMRYSSYRNVSFDYHGSFGTAYRTFITPLVIILALTGVLYGALFLLDPQTLTAMATGAEPENIPEDFEVGPEDMLFSLIYLVALPFLPYLDCLRVRLLANHSGYGNLPAQIKVSGGSFYRVYVVSFLLIGAIFTLALVAVMAVGFLFGFLLGDAGKVLMPVFFVAGFLLAYSAMIYAGGYFRAERTNLVYGNLSFAQARLHSSLQFHPVGMIYATNTLAILFTLGLYTPWAQVRMARYIASVTELEASDFDRVVGSNQAQQDSLGEGIIDAFDLDLGL